MWFSVLPKHSVFTCHLALIFQKSVHSSSTAHHLILPLLSTCMVLLSLQLFLGRIVVPLLLKLPQRHCICCSDSVNNSPTCSCNLRSGHLFALVRCMVHTCLGGSHYTALLDRVDANAFHLVNSFPHIDSLQPLSIWHRVGLLSSLSSIDSYRDLHREWVWMVVLVLVLMYSRAHTRVVICLELLKMFLWDKQIILLLWLRFLDRVTGLLMWRPLIVTWWVVISGGDHGVCWLTLWKSKLSLSPDHELVPRTGAECHCCWCYEWAEDFGIHFDYQTDFWQSPQIISSVRFQ